MEQFKCILDGELLHVCPRPGSVALVIRDYAVFLSPDDARDLVKILLILADDVEEQNR